MAESKLQANIDAFRDFVHANGWTIVEEKEIQFGHQLKVTDGITRISVDFFTTGRALIQGKPGELRTQIQAWWDKQKATSGQGTAPVNVQPALVETSSIAAPAPTIINTTGVPRIGLDESGKGDYFGPLVIGAVYVDERTESRLKALGVRDSKLLTDNRILAMAEEIKAL
jgi:ribonuclease HIII